MQVDPIKPTLKPPGTKHLKLKCEILLSTSAFKFNLRRYNWGMLVDFAHVLTDPDYVRWQVSGRGSLSSPLQLNLSRFGHTAPCPPV